MLRKYHCQRGRWLGLLALLWLAGLACAGQAGPETRTMNLSIVSQTLYGARPDKLIPCAQGEKVTFSITADEPMEVFLHGYDKGTRVTPGQTSTLEFAAIVPGRYPLMIHSLGAGKGERKVEILLGLVDVSPGN